MDKSTAVFMLYPPPGMESMGQLNSTDLSITSFVRVSKSSFVQSVTLCQQSVPESIICFLESENFEDALRNAISLGGDADTQAAIAGSIAEAFYNEIPLEMIEFALSRLSFHLLEIVKRYSIQFLDSKYVNIIEEMMTIKEKSLEEI
ncbi:ADP-ribosylglycohydrolase family protein [Spirochaeta isovalerica]|uniref:ADP-ribosylglycohydrolase n=1 Tax=Spirochaeta isovalerica TaxID=150 RepID=A0A841RAP3_9SPIO|nr:ADP-ribosylglycohydrolase family protein [Spirochaeta isovalerica]MBB6480317.1 hypothetical protein [Spirochaeta isovalerica]